MQRSTITGKTTLAFLAGVGLAGAGMYLTGAGPEHDSHAGAATHDPMGEHDPMGGMTEDEMMAEWMKIASPGEHHAQMARAVGHWKAETSFTMAPGAPAMEGTGTATSSWVLGGRYMKSDFHMDDMMGMPFDGLGYAGYDNAKQEYVSVWMDSFGTGIIYMTGTMDADKSVVSGMSMSPEGEKEMKIVTEWQDDNHYTDTFFEKMPDGAMRQSGQIRYTRQ